MLYLEKPTEEHITPKRRICLVRHGYYLEDVRDIKEARALIDAGYEVDVVCLRRKGQPPRETIDRVALYRISVTHKRTTVPRYIMQYSLSFMMFSFFLIVLHLRKRYCCINVATMPDFLVFTTIVPRILGAKVLLDLREPTPELWVTKYGDRLRTLLHLQTKIEQSAIDYADATITVTDELRDRVVERGARKEKISIVRNVCDKNALLGSPDQQTDSQTHHLRLITHGLIEERYGHIEIIKAVKNLRDTIPGLHLEILGSGEFQPQIEQLTQELNCSDIVEFAGFVPRDELFRRIHAANIGIIAMRRSPYSELVDTNKMYEYIALRKSIIISRLKPIKRQFDESCVKFFEPGDYEDLAQKILELFHDPQRGRQLAENAYKQYEKMQWESSKEVYLNVIGNLVLQN